MIWRPTMFAAFLVADAMKRPRPPTGTRLGPNAPALPSSTKRALHLDEDRSASVRHITERAG